MNKYMPKGPKKVYINIKELVYQSDKNKAPRKLKSHCEYGLYLTYWDRL
jgi:hypothetical protein